MTVEDVADELYSLPPEDFTAARTAAARADKANAKQIAGLRKPTVGAWLVNTLARSEPELLDKLLALGPALADAQRSGHGAALRDLGAQRRRLVAAVTEKAFASADRESTAAARAEVESTLEAALADPASADAVRSGRLLRSLSYAGFGEVDLDGAVAVGSPRAAPAKQPGAPAKAPKPDRSKDIAAAEARAHAAAGALDDAVRVCEQAQSARAQAEEAARQAVEAVTAAEEDLRAARDAKLLAEQQLRKAEHQTEQAEAAVADTQKKAEKARTALDRLRRT